MKYLTGSTYSFHRSNDKIAAVVNLLCIYLYLKYDTIERFYSELEVFTFVLRFSLWLVQSQQASPDSIDTWQVRVFLHFDWALIDL